MRLTPTFFLNLAASGTGQASVWIHQTSRRYSQAPFKNVKGAVQRVAFHPLKPHFFVAVDLFFFVIIPHFPLETAERAGRGILTRSNLDAAIRSIVRSSGAEAREDVPAGHQMDLKPRCTPIR